MSNNKKQNADKKIEDIEKDLQLPDLSEEQLLGEEEGAEIGDTTAMRIVKNWKDFPATVTKIRRR